VDLRWYVPSETASTVERLAALVLNKMKPEDVAKRFTDVAVAEFEKVDGKTEFYDITKGDYENAIAFLSEAAAD